MVAALLWWRRYPLRTGGRGNDDLALTPPSSGPIMAAEVGGMNTGHVDFSRPDWRCPDCTHEPAGPGLGAVGRLGHQLGTEQDAEAVTSTT